MAFLGSVSSLNCFMRREALAAELLLFIMDGAESELVGDEGGGGVGRFGVGCLWQRDRKKKIK